MTEHERGIGFALNYYWKSLSDSWNLGSSLRIYFYLSFSQKLNGASLASVIYAD